MTGRGVLVTGAASGFGREVSRQVAARGDRVVLLDVDTTAGPAVAAELGGHFLRCDVASLEEVLHATEEAERLAGGLHLAFLNAGISSPFDLGPGFDLLRYRQAMGVNLDGVVFGIHAVLPALLRSGGGSIVCTASMAGLAPTPFDPVYAANKHAVVGLVRSLGPALADQGVRVNAFCPGFAATAIIEPLLEDLTAQGVPVIPVETAGAAVLHIFDAPVTGEAWLLQAGLDLMPYRFRGLPAAVRPDGTKAAPLQVVGVRDREPSAGS